MCAPGGGDLSKGGGHRCVWGSLLVWSSVGLRCLLVPVCEARWGCARKMHILGFHEPACGNAVCLPCNTLHHPALTSLRWPALLCVCPAVVLQVSICPLDESCIAYILRNVLGGLMYLHEAGRLHRCVLVSAVAMCHVNACCQCVCLYCVLGPGS